MGNIANVVNAKDKNSYDWVPVRYRYLIDDPSARLKIRKAFYKKYGADAAVHSSLLRRIIRFFTCGEGLGISELKFLEWEIRRKVLDPLQGPDAGGSAWWRNVNLRFILNAQYALEIRQGKESHPITNELSLWLQFMEDATPRSWYRAHNASIVSAYFEFAADAARESVYEQTFMNEVLYRVLFAQAMVEDDTLFEKAGEFAANPLLPAVDLMVHIPAFYPEHYPLSKNDILDIMHKGHSLEGDAVRDFDDYLIYPHIPALYSEAAQWLNIPELALLQKDGKPVYPITAS